MNDEMENRLILTSIDKVFDRLDTIEKGMNDKFSKLESHVEKIEQQNNCFSERIVKLETRFDGLITEVKDEKQNNKALYEDVFKKINANTDKIYKDIPVLIESQNDKQNLKIISASVGIAGAVMGFIQFIIWMLSK